MANFINFVRDKALKRVVYFMLKQDSHMLFPQLDDPFYLSKGYTFAQTK